MTDGYDPIIRFEGTSILSDKNRVTPADEDNLRVLMIFVDAQNDFMDHNGAALPVQGAIADMRRAERWLYLNGHKVTRVAYSLDTHIKEQIFHPCWWHERYGGESTPGTTITYDEVANGFWIPKYDKYLPDKSTGLANKSYCLEYLRHLEEDGKKQLCIWPYHCICGTHGYELERGIANIIEYHAQQRNNKPYCILKGYDPWTEMYGIFRPEWSYDGYINTAAILEISQYDVVIFAGEAASHCVGETELQAMELIARKPRCKTKFVVLKDCMSAIPGFETQTEELYKRLEDEYGVLVVNSTDFTL